MTSGLMVRLLLDAARALGQAGKCPKEAIFSSEGLLDNRVDIYDMLSSESVSFDELPENPKLTKSDAAELN